jgi:hypothetical protein
LLSSRTRFEPASPDQATDAAPAPDIHLSLGADDERPFEHAEHWAAFTCTGA